MHIPKKIQLTATKIETSVFVFAISLQICMYVLSTLQFTGIIFLVVECHDGIQ